jgi:hypothetical protein
MAYEGALSSKAKASYPKSVVRKRYSTLDDNSDLASSNQPNLAKIRVVSQIAGRQDPLPNPYVGFFLVSVQEDRSEKAEIVPLPGDDYAAFFYGEMPRNIAFTGVLLNTEEDLWRDAFETLYEDHLRGTVNSARGSLVQIKYGERIVSGWLMNFSQSVRADSDLYTQFSFTVLVKSVHMLNLPAGSDTLYSRYIAGADSSLNLANPAKLNVADLDAAIDKVQTGYVAPPPKPRRGRGRRRSNCVINPELLSGGANNANQIIEDADAFFSQGRCRTTDVIQSYIDRAEDLQDRARKAANRGDAEATNRLLQQSAETRAVLGNFTEAEVTRVVGAEVAQDIATIQELPEVRRLDDESTEVDVRYGSRTLTVRRDNRGQLIVQDTSDLGTATLDATIKELREGATDASLNRAREAASSQKDRASHIREQLRLKREDMAARQRATTAAVRLSTATDPDED